MAIVKKPIRPKKAEVKETPKVNVQATKGTSRDQKVIKEGTPLEHSKMHNINKNSARTVGINIGITKNMGDYESLRVDCWITDEVLENETQAEALDRISEIAVDSLQRHIEELAE